MVTRYTRRQALESAALTATAGFVLRRLYAPELAWAKDAAYAVGPVAQPVTLNFQIKYQGKVPKPIMREVAVDQGVAGKEPRIWEGLNLGKGQVVKDAIVVIEGVAAGKGWAAEDPLAYAEKAFILERAGVYGWAKGSETSIRLENRDPILHSWVLTLDGRPGPNVATLPGKAPGKTKIKRTGLYELTCGPHPWERGFRVFAPTPYYGKSNDAGAVAISEVPSGAYTATIWAEGFVPQKAQIAAGQTEVKFEFTQAHLSKDLAKNV